MARNVAPSEVGVVADVVAETAELAHDVALGPANPHRLLALSRPLHDGRQRGHDVVAGIPRRRAGVRVQHLSPHLDRRLPRDIQAGNHKYLRTRTMIVGVDIGGTFTDVVCIDRRSGEIHFTKVSTNYTNIIAGVLDGVRKILGLMGTEASDIKRIAHGTTIATNVVVQRKGAKTSVFTTKGFEDVLGDRAPQAESDVRSQHRRADADLPGPQAPSRRRAGTAGPGRKGDRAPRRGVRRRGDYRHADPARHRGGVRRLSLLLQGRDSRAADPRHHQGPLPRPVRLAVVPM